MKNLYNTMKTMGGLATAAYLASGCASVNQSAINYNRVDPSQIKEAQRIASQPQNVDAPVRDNVQTTSTSSNLSAAESFEILGRYQNLESWNGTLVTPQEENNLYLAGIRNAYAGTLKNLESAFQGNTNVTSLEFGNPDASSTKGRSYQVSSNDGLCRVASYSSSTNTGISVNIRKTEGNTKDTYTVKFTFGLSQNDVKVRKITLDVHLATEAAINGSLGAAGGGLAGAGFFVAPSIINFGLGFAEKGKIPRGSELYSGFNPITSQSYEVSAVTHEINTAKDLGAKKIIVSGYVDSRGSTVLGIIDAPSAAKNIRFIDNTISYNLQVKDAFRFFGTIIKAVNAGALWFVNNEEIIQQGGHVTGETIGGPAAGHVIGETIGGPAAGRNQ